MGMVLMKANKSNTMTNYGDSIRTTVVSDGNSIGKTTINGNFIRITTNNGKFVETTIDNATSIKITKQGEELDPIANWNNNLVILFRNQKLKTTHSWQHLTTFESDQQLNNQIIDARKG